MKTFSKIRKCWGWGADVLETLDKLIDLFLFLFFFTKYHVNFNPKLISVISSYSSFVDRSCINFQSGSWVTLTHKLVHERWSHSSWTTPDGGILLIGGGSKYSENNTEIVYQNGSSISSFDLKYSTT